MPSLRLEGTGEDPGDEGGGGGCVGGPQGEVQFRVRVNSHQCDIYTGRGNVHGCMTSHDSRATPSLDKIIKSYIHVETCFAIVSIS